MAYFLPETDAVLLAARGLAQRYPQIQLSPDPLFLWNTARAPGRRVGLVAGGGSGHEPLHTGLLGRGGLDAVVPGEVFASPHNHRIYRASKAVAGEEGVLHIVKNYTGDKINFAIAAERLALDGVKSVQVVVDDDLATEGLGPGRRGTAAAVPVEKILGAAADRGDGPAELAALGRRVAAASRSLAVAARAHTSPAGVPVRRWGASDLDWGVGIHGEPGIRTVPRPPLPDLVRRMVGGVLEGIAPDPRHGVLVLISGLGATTDLELNAAAALAFDVLDGLGVHVAGIAAGTFAAALDTSGLSLTLTALEEGWLELWQAPHDTPVTLPAGVSPTAPAPAAPTAQAPFITPAAQAMPTTQAVAAAQTMPATPAAQAAPAAQAGTASADEPAFTRICDILFRTRDDLTDLDTAVGDGDIGDNIVGGVRIARTLAARSGAPGVSALASAFLDTVGGTSGPLFGLLFRHLAAALGSDGERPAPAALSAALAGAANAIARVGGARVGDKTMLDALVPAADSLGAGSAADDPAALTTAALAAIAGARNTASLTARRGRASYIGDRSQGIPDPGAVAVALICVALADVYEPATATRLPAPKYIARP